MFVKYDILFIYLTYWPENVVCIQQSMSSFSFKYVDFYIQVSTCIYVFQISKYRWH